MRCATVRLRFLLTASATLGRKWACNYISTRLGANSFTGRPTCLNFRLKLLKTSKVCGRCMHEQKVNLICCREPCTSIAQLSAVLICYANLGGVNSRKRYVIGFSQLNNDRYIIIWQILSRLLLRAKSLDSKPIGIKTRHCSHIGTERAIAFHPAGNCPRCPPLEKVVSEDDQK
jgi:hypothetical protein